MRQKNSCIMRPNKAKGEIGERKVHTIQVGRTWNVYKSRKMRESKKMRSKTVWRTETRHKKCYSFAVITSRLHQKMAKCAYFHWNIVEISEFEWVLIYFHGGTQNANAVKFKRAKKNKTRAKLNSSFDSTKTPFATWICNRETVLGNAHAEKMARRSKEWEIWSQVENVCAFVLLMFRMVMSIFEITFFFISWTN